MSAATHANPSLAASWQAGCRGAKANLKPGLLLQAGALALVLAYYWHPPTREALSRLSAEGLVARSDQRGFSVAPLKWDELPILTRNRVQLEGLALRESIEQRDPAWEDALVLLVHKLARTPRSLSRDHYVPNPAWEALHRDFHRTLLARCPSRWLRAFCDSLADEAYRFRQLAANQAFGSRDVHAEHVAIFEAAIDGRADAALQLLEQHYTRTSALVARQAA